MASVNACSDDLAYIHDHGYGQIARDAASRLIEELSALEFQTGTVVDFGCGSGILAHEPAGVAAFLARKPTA